MIDASEARKRSMNGVDAHVKMQLERLNELITNNADRGKTFLTVECFLSPEVKRKLVSLGYTIKSEFPNNQPLTVISWEG